MSRAIRFDPLKNHSKNNVPGDLNSHSPETSTPKNHNGSVSSARVPNSQSSESAREKLLYSVPEAAYVLNVSKSMIRAYVRTGLMKTVHLPHPSGIGFINRVLIAKQDLECFVKKWGEHTAHTR